MKSKIESISSEEFASLVKSYDSFASILRTLGYSLNLSGALYRHLKNRIKRESISVDHILSSKFDEYLLYI